MKYLCLVHCAPAVFEAMSRADFDALAEESMAYDRALDSQGRLIAAEALMPAKAARVVQRREGRVTHTDGPLRTDLTEPLVGFVLIDAPDLETATRLAGGIPLARHGRIEVRAVFEGDGGGAAAEERR